MNDLSLYEKVSPLEKNFPVKFGFNSVKGCCRPHWHEHIELLYYKSDNCKVFCDGKTYVANADELIIVNSSELHFTYGGDFFCMRINPSFFSDVNFNNARFKTHIVKDSIIKECFEKIYEEKQSMREGYDMETKAVTYHLMCHLLRHYKTEELSENDVILKKNKAHKIGEVLKFIAANCQDSLTTASLAEHFHLSEHYFCSMFKSQTGMSPVNYINKFRIEKAAVLLENTDLSVTEIALSVGFGDSNYFSRTFKKYMGTTPKEYKKKGM